MWASVTISYCRDNRKYNMYELLQMWIQREFIGASWWNSFAFMGYVETDGLVLDRTTFVINVNEMFMNPYWNHGTDCVLSITVVWFTFCSRLYHHFCEWMDFSWESVFLWKIYKFTMDHMCNLHIQWSKHFLYSHLGDQFGLYLRFYNTIHEVHFTIDSTPEIQSDGNMFHCIHLFNILFSITLVPNFALAGHVQNGVAINICNLVRSRLTYSSKSKSTIFVKWSWSTRDY